MKWHCVSWDGAACHNEGWVPYLGTPRITISHDIMNSVHPLLFEAALYSSLLHNVIMPDHHPILPTVRSEGSKHLAAPTEALICKYKSICFCTK